jgi:hypothetical protein
MAQVTPNYHKIYQKAMSPSSYKSIPKVVKYTKILPSKSLQKWDFWYENKPMYHLATMVQWYEFVNAARPLCWQKESLKQDDQMR